SSSRTPGIAKSSVGLMSGPRSSPTTCRPALVSSRAMMLPVQPMPTMTASTSFKRVAMAPSSRKVRDRLPRHGVPLLAIVLDQVGVGRGQARKADHLPRHLVAVAAVDRIGEEALHGEVEERVEKLLAVEIDEVGLALVEQLDRLFALALQKTVEILALGLTGPRIDRHDAGGEELARRQHQLIAVLGLGLAERTTAIELCAAAPRAGELAIDECHDAALGAGRRELVGRHDDVHGR